MKLADVRLAAVLVVILVVRSVPALGGERSEPPGDAVAWWRLDPEGFHDEGAAATRRAIESVLRAAVGSGAIPGDDAEGIIAGVLAASVVGARAHSAWVRARPERPERPEGAGGAGGVPIEVTVVLHSPDDHAELMRTVGAIVLGGGGKGGVQSAIDLPGGQRGVRFRRAGWDEGVAVEWASLDDGFFIGLGSGCLSRSVNVGDGGVVTRWSRHRAAIPPARRAGRVFFESYVSVDRLRHAFPDAFDGGIGNGIAGALALENGRDVMLHARWVGEGKALSHPPLLSFDLTWSMRSEPACVVRTTALSESSWPDGVGMAPPAGRYAIVIGQDAMSWVDSATSVYGGLFVGEERVSFDRARRAWDRRHGGMRRRLIGSLGEWVVLSDAPKAPLAVPGATTVFVPLREGAKVDRFVRLMNGTLRGFDDVVGRVDGERAWVLFVDEGRSFRALTWGVVEGREGPVLVGGLEVGVGAGDAGLALLRRVRRLMDGVTEEE